MKRNLFVFCLVLVLSCSFAFAFPQKTASSKPSVEVATEKSAKTSQTSTETMEDSKTSSTNYDDLVAYLDGKVILTPAQVKELQDATAKVGTDIDSLKADLKKANRFTKYTTKMGLAFGFKEGVGMQYGALGAFEIGLGNWSIGLGAQYMIGTMDDCLHMFNGYKWSLDNATAQMTIGYTF